MANTQKSCRTDCRGHEFSYAGQLKRSRYSSSAKEDFHTLNEIPANWLSPNGQLPMLLGLRGKVCILPALKKVL